MLRSMTRWIKGFQRSDVISLLAFLTSVVSLLVSYWDHGTSNNALAISKAVATPQMLAQLVLAKSPDFSHEFDRTHQLNPSFIHIRRTDRYDREWMEYDELLIEDDPKLTHLWYMFIFLKNYGAGRADDIRIQYEWTTLTDSRVRRGEAWFPLGLRPGYAWAILEEPITMPQDRTRYEYFREIEPAGVYTVTYTTVYDQTESVRGPLWGYGLPITGGDKGFLGFIQLLLSDLIEKLLP